MKADQYLTYREIARQQDVWNGILQHFIAKKDQLTGYLDEFKQSIWVFTGCGTSYYIAQSASYAFTTITGLPSIAVASSEILISAEVIFSKGREYVLVPISRSGTTTEAVLAARRAGKLGIKTLGISCTPGSEMVQACYKSVTFPFEPEKSVVMTGSFTSQLLTVIFISLLLENNPSNPHWQQLNKLAEDCKKFIIENEEQIKTIAENLAYTDFVFLGQNIMTGIAKEAALKMQEMTISTSQGYHTLEYRHGPKSTASKNSLITVIVSENGQKLEQTIVNELRELGASVLLIASENAIDYSTPDFSLALPPGYSSVFHTMFAVNALQLLGFYRALAKGFNPDVPQNLSQVVTLDIKE